jgi:hypothetical protein
MNDLDTRPAQTARRSRKKIIIGTVVVVAVLAGAVGLALFQPWKLFTRSTVNEGFPVAASAPAAPPSAGTSAPTAEPTSGPSAEPTSGPSAGPTGAGAEPPAAEPVVLASGTFVDGEHTTTGTASIFQLPDGSRILRLEDFSTSDGPDVDVALSDQAAGGDDWGKYDDARYVGLGNLKGTDGNQNYEIPADVDLAGLSSVVVWCDRFNVAFGTAAITV